LPEDEIWQKLLHLRMQSIHKFKMQDSSKPQRSGFLLWYCRCCNQRRHCQRRLLGGGKKSVVVIGNSMVGQRFMENLINLNKDKTCTISTFCKELHAAYNRVKLTLYFEMWDPLALSMTPDYNGDSCMPWYKKNNVKLLLNDKAVLINIQSKMIVGASGKTLDYNVVVFAMGLFSFVPSIPGRQPPGIFVYRVTACFLVCHPIIFPRLAFYTLRSRCMN
jgi:hypothetical protein